MSARHGRVRVELPRGVVAELRRESNRRGISISAIAREAWEYAQPRLRKLQHDHYLPVDVLEVRR